MDSGTDQAFEAWKQQVNSGLRILDTLVEGTAKMHTTQLSAANETHERMREAGKLLAGAKNPQELWNAQWEWAMGNCERSGAYWRSLFETMTEANARLLASVQENAATVAGEPSKKSE